MSPNEACIRPAQPDDVELLVALIRELAQYEQLEHEAKAVPEALRQHLFGPRPFAEAMVAEIQGHPVGFALFFHSFSTFRGQPGLYLEDIYVRPEHRRRGVGKALLYRLAALTRERGCGRLEWAVLDWNQPAIDFYRTLGAYPMSDWTIFRLDGQALEALGHSSGPQASSH